MEWLKVLATVLLVAVLGGYFLLAGKTWTLQVRDERYAPLPATTLLVLRDGAVVERLVTDDAGRAEVAVGKWPWEQAWAVIACRPGWYATQLYERQGRRIGTRPLASSTTDVLMFPRIVRGPTEAFRPYKSELPPECFE